MEGEVLFSRCLFCASPCRPTFKIENGKVIRVVNIEENTIPPFSLSFSSKEEEPLVAKQLEGIFILRHILKVSEERLHQFLSKLDGGLNPEYWVRVCDSCGKAVSSYFSTVKKMIELQKTLGSISTRLKVKIKATRESLTSTSEQDPLFSLWRDVREQVIRDVETGSDAVTDRPPPIDWSLFDDNDADVDNALSQVQDASSEDADELLIITDSGAQSPSDIAGQVTNWRCAVCPPEFTSEEELSSHLREKHQQMMTYKCCLCNTTVNTLDLFNIHMINFHGIKDELPSVGAIGLVQVANDDNCNVITEDSDEVDFIEGSVQLADHDGMSERDDELGLTQNPTGEEIFPEGVEAHVPLEHNGEGDQQALDEDDCLEAQIGSQLEFTEDELLEVGVVIMRTDNLNVDQIPTVILSQENDESGESEMVKLSPSNLTVHDQVTNNDDEQEQVTDDLNSVAPPSPTTSGIPEPDSRQILVQTRKKFKCDSCIFRCARRYRLVAHQDLHKPNSGSTPCPTCGVFMKSESIIRHLRIHHQDSIQITDYTLTRKTFKCRKCPFEIHKTKYSKLRAHIELHKPNSGAVTCPLCHWLLNPEPKRIKGHNATKHPGQNCKTENETAKLYKVVEEKKGLLFKCLRCAFQVSKSRDLLKSHLKIHELKADDVALCPQCGWLIRANTMHCHMNSKHPVQNEDSQKSNIYTNYKKCGKCGALVIKLRDFKEHMKLHEEGGGEVCDVCGWLCKNISKHKAHFHPKEGSKMAAIRRRAAAVARPVVSMNVETEVENGLNDEEEILPIRQTEKRKVCTVNVTSGAAMKTRSMK